jgi:hypothetical protein
VLDRYPFELAVGSLAIVIFGVSSESSSKRLWKEQLRGDRDLPRRTAPNSDPPRLRCFFISSRFQAS